MLADYLAAGEPLPKPLALPLASVFRRSMDAPSAERGNTLSFELGFTAPAKVGAPTKHVDHMEVRAIVEREFASPNEPSEAKLAKIISKRFGVSLNTARKHLKGPMLVPTLLKRNGLTSLVLPRRAQGDGSTE